MNGLKIDSSMASYASLVILTVHLEQCLLVCLRYKSMTCKNVFFPLYSTKCRDI